MILTNAGVFTYVVSRPPPVPNVLSNLHIVSRGKIVRRRLPFSSDSSHLKADIVKQAQNTHTYLLPRFTKSPFKKTLRR